MNLDHLHFFLTLSSNEWTWKPLENFLRDRNKDLPSSYSFNQLIMRDPVSVSIFFEKKYRTFMNHVLLNKFMPPLGIINNYFVRREYQQRGAPHMHMKLWAATAPKIGIDNDEVIISYIDKYITCRIPDPEREPRLHELVTRFQIHTCTSSCQKTISRKNSKYNYNCI